MLSSMGFYYYNEDRDLNRDPHRDGCRWEGGSTACSEGRWWTDERPDSDYAGALPAARSAPMTYAGRWVTVEPTVDPKTGRREWLI